MQKKLLSFLQTLNSGENYRGDCPECGGNNTFSATNDYGTVRYHCFRASCSLSGSIHKEMTNEDVSAALNAGLRGQPSSSKQVFSIPDHFVSVAEREEVIDYLRKNNCLSAYYERRADIRYDPKQNRVVFLIKEDGVTYDAVGRSLDRSIAPKWYRYGSSTILFSCNANLHNSRGMVLVEDCASACAVSFLYGGIALLGTQLGSTRIVNLLKYNTIYIALDKDASDKAFDMQRYLSFYCKDVKIVLLERDLKYLKEKEIENVIRRFS